jgi:hypothetical protein
MIGPQNFEESSSPYRYSPMGRNYGDPMLNILFRGMFGQNYMPKPDEGQDMYDAFMQRERTGNFMQLQRAGFANNMLFQQMGISTNPMVGMVGSMFGSPDGALGKMMSPFLGGNPMAATMGMYAGMTGPKMRGFREGGGISMGETESTMKALMDNFYSTQSYENRFDAEKNQMIPGAREEMDKQGREFVREQYKRGPEGQKYLRELGIKGLKFDGGEGKISQEDEERINKLSFTAGENESELAKNLRSRLSKKTMVAGDTEQELQKMLNTSDEKLQKELSKNLETRLKDKLGAHSDAVKKALNSKGILDPGKTQQLIEEYRKVDPLEKLRESSEKLAEIGQRYTGFNYKNSRGFKVEDIVSGFTGAAGLRMLGETRGKSASEAMAGFSSNAVGAMSAARTFFGNKPPQQLMRDISDMMGGSAVDLTTREGAAKIEDKIRQMQSVASRAGVSSRSLMGFAESIKDRVQSTPQLQYMNNANITQLATNALKAGTNMADTMSAAEFRQSGGMQGISSELVKSSLDYQQSELGGFQAALLYKAKMRGPEAFEAMKKRISEGKLTPQDLRGGGAAALAKELGMSVNELMTAGQNTSLQQRALKDQDVGAVMGSPEAMKNMTSAIFDQFSYATGGQSKEDFLKEFAAAKKNNPQLSAEDFISDKFSMLDSEDAELLDRYRGAMKMEMSEATMGPEEIRAREAREQRDIQRRKELDEKFGQAYSPIAQQALGALLEGGTVEDMAGALGGIFATRGGAQGDTEATKAQLEEAKKSGAGITKILQNTATGEGAVKAGLAGELNKLIDQRQTIAEARGEVKSVEGTHANLSDEDLLLFEKYGKSALSDIKTPEDVDKEIRRMEGEKSAQGVKFDEDLNNKLKSLRIFKSSGASFETAKRGGAAALAVGVMDAQMQQDAKARFDEAERGSLSDMGESLLEKAEGSAELSEVLKNYGVTGAGWTSPLKKLKEDLEKDQGTFKLDADKKRSGVSAEVFQTLQSEVGKTSEKINAARLDALGSPEGTGAGAGGDQKDLAAMIGELIKTISGDNSITKAFKDLALALQ